jgi:hypothetical protein
MKVLNMKENDDGSCTLELEITELENWKLVEYAIIHILEEQIKNETKQ